MSGSSTSMSSLRNRRRVAPTIPLVRCPDCGMKARVYVSGTTEHSGWTFYRCKNHGSTCDFWHWEREYVEYLIQNDVLKGDAATEAYCWAEERREELEAALGKKKLQEEWGRGNGECIAGGGSSSNQGRGDSRYQGRGTDNEMVRKMLVMQKIGTDVCVVGC